MSRAFERSRFRVNIIPDFLFGVMQIKYICLLIITSRVHLRGESNTGHVLVEELTMKVY